MKTILLAGYRIDTEIDDAPGLTPEVTGEVRLNRRIEQLRALGLDVICVVAGDAAETQIRRAPRLAECELVFDTNAPDVSICTNVRAGLAAAGRQACFCLPVEVPCPPAELFRNLRRAIHGGTDGADVVQAGAREGVEAFGFPLLVTARGAERLATLPDLRSLTDPRLEYLYLNL